MTTPASGAGHLEDVLRALLDAIPPDVPSLAAAHPELAAARAGAVAFQAMAGGAIVLV